MASKVNGLGATNTVAVIAATVFFANWLSAKYLAYPFAWCFGKWALQPVLEPWTFVTHFGALAYMVVKVWTLNPINIAKGLAVVVFFFGLPMFLEILFSLGKTCN